jgi:hypothetical protein
MSFFKALRTISAHWRDMYRIGKINNKMGAPYWSFKASRSFSQQLKKDFKELKKRELELGYK